MTKSFYPTWDGEAYRKYLALFGLDENKKQLELSEGMKVKSNLLLALSHKAEVLILDEPTSGLDPFSRDELLELFGALKAHGVTILCGVFLLLWVFSRASRAPVLASGDNRHSGSGENRQF